MENVVLKDRLDGGLKKTIPKWFVYPVHIICAFKQLFHVEFNMAGLQLDALVVKKASKVMIHVRKNHVY